MTTSFDKLFEVRYSILKGQQQQQQQEDTEGRRISQHGIHFTHRTNKTN
jgi:hypothetical protein